MSSYDREYVDRVLAELEGDLGFAEARRSLLVALKWRIRDCPEQQYALWRLARAVDGRVLAWLHPRPRRSSSLTTRSSLLKEIPPFGWRAEYEHDRDVLQVMPAWVYYPRRWWRRARLWLWWRRYGARR